MRISLLQLFLAAFFAGSALATDSHAQDLLTRRVTMSVQNREVSQVLHEMERQARIQFIFSSRVINIQRKVSFDVVSQPLSYVLDTYFRPLGIDYEATPKIIILRATNRESLSLPEKLRSLLPSFAPVERVVTGTVTDEKGEPLVGVNILLRNTSRGTTTKADGTYSISIPESGAVLVFSFIGYQKSEVSVGNQTVLNVSLQPDLKKLDEVVVVGYGTQSKADLVGSVAQVNAEKINNRTVPKLSQALTGQMPGVTIIQSSGQPGSSGGTIQIRGVGSFGATTTPLVLVDGIPTNSFNDVNPNDVESVSVLKDASSAAIYGARAANGVILVTTKTGKQGKLKVTYNGYAGFQRMTATPQFVGSAEYAQLLNEAIPGSYSDAQIAAFRDGSNPDQYPNSNFIKATLKNGSSQTSHNVTITSGGATSQFLLSFGYLRQNGIVDKNHFDRYNLRLNLVNQLSKKVSFTTRLTAVQGIDNQPAPPATLDFNDMVTLISQVVRFAPIFPIRMSNGDWGTGAVNKGTPVSYLASDSFYKYRSTDLGINTRLDWKVTDDLTLSAIGGYTQLGERSTRFLASQRLTSAINLGPSSLTEGTANTRYQTFQALADYKKAFGNHTIGILAGYSFESGFNESLGAGRSGLPSNSVTVINAGDANSQTTNGTAEEWALESYFGRFQYNYSHKYLLEATARYDGSSRFPKNRKYALFPSVAVGWRIGEEAFLKDRFSWLSELKLKASYGTLGNQNIGNYPYQNVLNTGSNYSFGGTVSPGVARTTITDSTLHWESTRTKDIGLEIGLFKRLLNLSVTYFDKYTYDILVSPSASVSNVLGFTVGQQNSGSLSNKGWEFMAEHQNRIGDFTYSVGANLTYLKNTVLDLGVGNVRQPNGLVGNGSTLFVGQPMNLYYGYQTDGLFTDASDVTAWANQTAVAPNAKPGDIRYKDLSGPDGKPDGKIDATYDRKVLGSRIPRITYGINLSAGYKGFDLGALFQGVSQVSGYLDSYAGWAFNNQGNVQRWQADNRWTAANPNRNALYPRMEVITNQGTNNTLTSSFWVLNGAYLRLKSIQLGYTVPAAATKRLQIERVRLYASAENLHTWSHYRKGWDPEINTGGSYYPILANYTFSLNVTF